MVENTSARSPRGVPRKVLVIKSFHAKRPLGRVGMWTDGIRIGHGLHVIAEWRSDLIWFRTPEDDWPKGAKLAYQDVWDWTDETLRKTS